MVGKKVSEAEKAEIIKQYREYKSIREIADTTKRCRDTITGVLKEKGIKVRPGSFNYMIIPREIYEHGDNLPPWWVVGFTDGEGSFMIIINKDKRYSSGYKVYPVFQIAQKDSRFLEEVKTFFGFGDIIKHYDKRFKNSQHAYVAKGFSHALKLIQFFDLYLPKEKEEDYKKWRKIIMYVLDRDFFLREKDVHYINILRPCNSRGGKRTQI